MSYLGTAYSEEFRKHFEHSIRIIVDNPELYQELKDLLKRVVYHVVDIDEYLELAEAICEVIDDLTKEQPEKIFDLFYIFIMPDKAGTAQSLRLICEALLQKIEAFRDYRREKISLRVVVNNAPVEVKFIKKRKKKALAKNLKKGIVL